MTPDYRAMCAELIDALAEWRLGGGPPEDTADADLIDRARALLAEPEPGEVPRIGHILRLAEIIREVDGRHDKGAAALAEAILSHPGICSAGLAALAQPVAEGPTDEELLRTYGIAKRDHCYEGDLDDWPKKSERAATVAGIRAVLSRWGRPTPQPVAVSERLPSAADCDVEDNCWWFDPHADGAWYVDTFQSCYTHWLPANALPTPDAKP